MKNSLYISILMITGAIRPIFGQLAWNQFPLTGAEAKIITATQPPRFNISLTCTVDMGSAAPQNIAMPTIQNAAYSPETAAQLFEKLGGQFTIGNYSGTQEQTIAMPGRIKTSPALQLGIRCGRHFEVRVAAQHFRSEWSDEFPVVAIPFQQEHPLPPRTLQGSMNASVSAFAVNLETALFVMRGSIRPYVAGGVRGLFPVQTFSGAEIAGVALPVNIEPAETSFSPVAGAGLRWSFWKHAFLDAGCSYGRLPDGEYHPMAGASIGWAF